jgi:hypothetical protein
MARESTARFLQYAGLPKDKGIVSHALLVQRKRGLLAPFAVETLQRREQQLPIERTIQLAQES